MKTVVTVLGAMASEERLRIMGLLNARPQTDRDLADELNQSVQDVRAHLAVLATSGCVVSESTASGTTLYRLVSVEEANDEVYDVLAAMQTLIVTSVSGYERSNGRTVAARGARH